MNTYPYFFFQHEPDVKCFDVKQLLSFRQEMLCVTFAGVMQFQQSVYKRSWVYWFKQTFNRFIRAEVKIPRHWKYLLTRLCCLAFPDNYLIFHSDIEVDGRMIVEYQVIMEL